MRACRKGYWPVIFRRAGYTTFHVGKWHQDRDSFRRSYLMGEAIHFSGMSDHYAVDIRPFDASGVYPDSDVRIEKGIHSSELFANAAVRFLRSEDAQKPFFAYIAFTAPHDPREAPREYRGRYEAADMLLPPNFMPQHPFDNGELKVRDELLESYPRKPKAIQKHLADYYAMISHLDSPIGRILETLDETGLASNTIVVFAGDNGIALGQHGLMGKQNLYEHSLHVPLIFRGPGIAAGKTCDALVYLSDVYLTLCDLASIPRPPLIEGESLVTAMNDNASGRDSLFFAYKHFQRALRWRPWKLILYNVRGNERTQLFNLEEDPWEMQDRSEDPSCTSRLRK
ncbi:MAG TPA: sulfatase-like hydrolase/transferase [Candidatus Hydrogenedentes bacterium]|nr:sulfatase-like hydrolase/transferase [Candidatus Hydrogenedentota bacterium]HOL77388.1 sulfatase-like hydrolase/transferase [Candidatus Hydrogenedentota bacterium]HPO87583.1 sulfatase-like hydrolase/transferase [Candidatus Hydrogenedentota bacterium]